MSNKHLIIAMFLLILFGAAFFALLQLMGIGVFLSFALTLAFIFLVIGTLAKQK